MYLSNYELLIFFFNVILLLMSIIEFSKLHEKNKEDEKVISQNVYY